MPLDIRDFDALVAEQASTVQGASSRSLIDFGVGSILRAVAESTAALILWLQGLILAVLGLTRAGTSQGIDLDSWMADFDFPRLVATRATGTVTFARFTATTSAFVPITAQVETGDGANNYQVTDDPTNAAYSATLGGYTIPPGAVSFPIPVAALTPGARANALAGQISTLAQALPGVDTVTNPSPFTTGSNAESDPAFRARFVNWIASLSRAVRTAVAYAIGTNFPGVAYTIVENQNLDGTPNPGFFYVLIDDGTGAPPPSLIGQVYGVIDPVRPLGVRFAVLGPVIQSVNVALTIAAANAANKGAAAPIVQAALKQYINTLPVGSTLAWSRLLQIVYDATPLVTNATGLVLNGGAVDIIPAANGVLKVGTVTVS